MDQTPKGIGGFGDVDSIKILIRKQELLIVVMRLAAPILWRECPRISAVRWLAIMGIFFGCCLNQIPQLLEDSLSSGVLWTCLLAMTNAGGAVINEFVMKQSPHLDINLQNSIM